MTDVLDAPQVTPTASTALHYGLTKFADPLHIPSAPRPRNWGGRDHVTVSMQRTQVRLHSQLPPTTVWAYDGGFPGPTFEVRSGHRVRVHWVNDIEGTIPLVGVQVPPGTTDQPGYDKTLAKAKIIDGGGRAAGVDHRAPARRAHRGRQRRLAEQLDARR